MPRMTPYSRKRKSELKSEWYKKLRLSVYARDGFTCQMCFKTGGYLNAHHIETYRSNRELRFDKDNLITLCAACHKKIFRKEKHFIEYFKEIISLINKGQGKKINKIGKARK